MLWRKEMNITEEFLRMQNLIENMPMHEYEQMLERNGINRILPSDESSYVRCMKENRIEQVKT